MASQLGLSISAKSLQAKQQPAVLVSKAAGRGRAPKTGTGTKFATAPLASTKAVPKPTTKTAVAARKDGGNALRPAATGTAAKAPTASKAAAATSTMGIGPISQPMTTAKGKTTSASTSTASRVITAAMAAGGRGGSADDGPQPKSMSRGKVWSEELEDAYRFQLAGFRDSAEYRQFHGEEPDRWPNGLVKVLRLKNGYYYCYNRNRECANKDIHRTKLYVY